MRDGREVKLRIGLSRKETLAVWTGMVVKRNRKQESPQSKPTGGAICVSEVIDISPGNFDSSLCFIQPSISPDVFCI